MARPRPDRGHDRSSDGAERTGSDPPPADHGTSGANVVAGGLWQVASHLAPQLQVLVISVVAARALGVADMGRQSFIAFVSMSIVALATGGLPFALSRFVGRSMGEGRRGLVPALYHRSWRFETVAAIAGATVIVVIGQFRGELETAWAWAAAGAAVAVLHTVPANLLGGLQRWRDVSRVSLIVGVATTTTIVVVLVRGGGISEMFLVGAVVGSVGVVWTKRLADRAVGTVAGPSTPIPAELRREYLTYAGWMTLQVVLTFVVWQRSEFWFLDHFASDEEIAIYSIAFAAVLALGRVPFALAQVAFPAFATLDGAGEVGRMTVAVNRILRVQVLAALPMAAFFVAAGPALLTLVYGREYQDTGAVLRVLMVGFPLLPLTLTGGAVLMGRGLLRRLVAVYACGAAANLGLDLALIPGGGAVGAAWANTITQSVIGLVLAVAVDRVVGGLEIGRRRVVTGLVVNGAALAVGLFVAGRAGPPLPTFIASGAAVAVVSWIGGGLLRVFPPGDVAWLADASAERLGRRASSLVRVALAPFG